MAATAGARFRPGLGTAGVEERWRRVGARLRSSGREGFERGGELGPGGRAAASSARSRRALRKKERNGMGREGSRVLAMIRTALGRRGAPGRDRRRVDELVDGQHVSMGVGAHTVLNRAKQ